MSSYIIHRATTLLAFAGLVSAVGLWSQEVDGWWWLLAIVTVFGYLHYLIGGFYQFRQLRRDEHARRFGFVALLMTIVSLGAVMFVLLTDTYYLLSFFVIMYFLWHGYENEITLFERQTGRLARRDTVGALVLTTLALALFGVGHASWYFTPWYEFVASTPVVYELLPGGSLLPIVSFWLGIISATIAVGLAAHACVFGTARLFHGVFLFSILGVLVLGALFVPLHYVVVLGGLLFYHFMVWFLFYEERFRQRNKREWLSYGGIHAIILLPFLISLLLDWQSFLTFTLNSYVFLSLTLVHISLSFLNEQWLRALITR